MAGQDPAIQTASLPHWMGGSRPPMVRERVSPGCLVKKRLTLRRLEGRGVVNVRYFFVMLNTTPQPAVPPLAVVP